ncbi:hypothetical protein DFQ26_009896 [Actinomortierella ambigua]|nr:hypothetical protein DFQ26_009896 [Actinomortierella ambigua]
MDVYVGRDPHSGSSHALQPRKLSQAVLTLKTIRCKDRDVQNPIYIPRDGAPYQLGGVLDAVHARGYDILRFDVYPWRYAENIDIVKIDGSRLTNNLDDVNILGIGLKRSLGPNCEVVELELMGVKTERPFWPSISLTMYVRTVADVPQPRVSRSTILRASKPASP